MLKVNLNVCSIVLVCIISVLFAGCGKPPTVNARGNDEQRQESMKRVKESLPPERHDEFQEAMGTLLFADVDDLADLANSERIERRFEDRVHGLTGEEIINKAAYARELQAEREWQKKLEEINLLASKIKPESNAELSPFAVERARFKISNESGFGRDATIELSVINGTEYAVSRAYFHASLRTPGRELPWIDAEFNYQIPGGLEPGERASWNLSPNMFGEWRNAPEDRFDTVFLVRTIRIEKSDGESIGRERLSDREKKRLYELLDGYEGARAHEVRALMDARQAADNQWSARMAPFVVLEERDELLKAREQINQFQFQKTQIERGSGFLSEPTVQVLLRNESPAAIEWVRGKIRITSPGRQVPWDEGSFLGLLRPSLEPNKEAWLDLSKSSDYGMGRWILPPEGVNPEIHVRIESAEGPESQSPFEVQFSTQDELRLVALESMIDAENWDE